MYSFTQHWVSLFRRSIRMHSLDLFSVKAREAFEKELVATSKRTPKKIFAHVQRNRRLQNRISVLKVSNGNAIVDPASQAELISECFSTAFRHGNGFHSPPFYKESIPMEAVHVSSDVVETILRSLDEHKSSGPDELHPKILKILTPFIAKPLAHLCNLSLATGQVPNDWRTAKFCPIFKKGSREISGNYRPVSLTSIVCKMLESILKQSIMHHLQRTEAISKSQHGFLPKKSCLTN